VSNAPAISARRASVLDLRATGLFRLIGQLTKFTCEESVPEVQWLYWLFDQK